MKEYLRKKREDRDNKLRGTTCTVQQQIARQNSIVKASKTSSTLNSISGETDGNQTKSKSDANTRNLARDI